MPIVSNRKQRRTLTHLSWGFVLIVSGLPTGCKEKPPGPQETVWNGEGEEGSGKGWADCDHKPNCKAEVSLAAGKGYNASSALHFHGEGPGYLGAGWNWFGWWPKDAGTDFGPYDTLRLSLRVVVIQPNPPPKDLGLTLSLSSSTAKKKSKPVKLAPYVDDDIADGKWHQVDVPLDEFYVDGFDRRKVWELSVGSWTKEPRSIDIYVDNVIALEK